MIRKRKIEDEVVVCDDCKAPQPEYRVGSLFNCFICGKDLCVSHIKQIGNFCFCRSCHKLVMEYINNLRTDNKKLIAIYENEVYENEQK